MTPYAKAKQLIDDVVEFSEIDLPKLKYAQVGAPHVIAHEVFTVAVSGVDPHGQYGPFECNASQLSTFLVIIAWNCSWTSETDGSDDPRKIKSVSEKLDATGQMLWDFASRYQAYLSKEWSITFALTGGIGITTLSFTIGVD